MRTRWVALLKVCVTFTARERLQVKTLCMTFRAKNHHNSCLFKELSFFFFFFYFNTWTDT